MSNWFRGVNQGPCNAWPVPTFCPLQNFSLMFPVSSGVYRTSLGGEIDLEMGPNVGCRTCAPWFGTAFQWLPVPHFPLFSVEDPSQPFLPAFHLIGVSLDWFDQTLLNHVISFQDFQVLSMENLQQCSWSIEAAVPSTAHSISRKSCSINRFLLLLIVHWRWAVVELTFGENCLNMQRF